MSTDLRDRLRRAYPAGEVVRSDPQEAWRRGLVLRRRRRIVQGAVAVGGLTAAVAMASIVVGALTAPSAPDILDRPPGAPGTRGAAVRLPLDDIAQGVSAGVIEDRRVFFARSGDRVEVFIAAAQHLPNEGLWWCPGEQVFASPFHGELFDSDGRAIAGPASRDLDRLAVDVRGGDVIIDPSSVIPGGPANPEGTKGVSAGANAGSDGEPWDDSYCAGHEPDQDPPTILLPGTPPASPPEGARPVMSEDLPRELLELFVAAETEVVLALPASGGQVVYVTPDSEPPLLFGTSCDVVSSVDLPAGWLGYCLERTDDGELMTDLFPWGTTSTPVGTSDVEMQADAVWRSAADDADDAVRRFAAAAFGWGPDAVTVEGIEESPGPMFVTASTDETDTEIQMLLAPGRTGQWQIFQVGPNGGPGGITHDAIELPIPNGATTMDVYAFVVDRTTHFSRRAATAIPLSDLGVKSLDELGGVLIVYRDREGQVVGARGGQFGTADQPTEPARTPNGGDA